MALDPLIDRIDKPPIPVILRASPFVMPSDGTRWAGTGHLDPFVIALLSLRAGGDCVLGDQCALLRVQSSDCAVCSAARGRLRAVTKHKRDDESTRTTEQAYAHFLPHAQALDAREVRPYTGFASVVYHNVSDAVDVLRKEESAVPKEIAKANFPAVYELPDLALALQHAVSVAEKVAVSPPPTRKQRDQVLGRVQRLRRIMLSAAETHAAMGELPEDEVARIRTGMGPRDAAQDCIDLAALFRPNLANLKGRTPVTETIIDEATQAGTELLKFIRPSGATKAPKLKEVTTAVDVRNRLFTLLVRRYEVAWRIGAWLWGYGVEDKIPALHAHQRATHTASGDQPIEDKASASSDDPDR